jgi:glucosamine-6-phosphate deaminase
MRLIITEEHVGDWAAYYIAKKILDFAPTKEKPFVLGIPGGGTAQPMYKRLVEFHKDGVLSFENVVFFNTGEYLGIDTTNIHSFHSIVNASFFNWVDAKAQNIHLLNPLTSNVKQEGMQMSV